MALITVNLRLVRPQGTNDAPDPATGRVDFIPAAHGKYHNSLRTVEKVTSQIDAEGEMIPVELTPALWKVTISPSKGNPWPEMLFELTEGMPEPVNLAELLPQTVVNGVQLAKGDPGPSIVSWEDNEDGTIKFLLSDGSYTDSGILPRGPQGMKGDQGPIGPIGPQGAEGPKGDQGVQGPIGPAGMTWRGIWDPEEDYINDDSVYHEGSSWFAAGDPAPGEEPSTDSAHWNALAMQGAQGIQGSQGIQGPEGPQGPIGLTGPAPELVWDGTSLVIDGGEPVDLKGDPGEGGGGIAGAVPIFATLAEAQAWEAENPGKVALVLGDGGEVPVDPVEPGGPNDFTHQFLGSDAKFSEWTDAKAGLSLSKEGEGLATVSDGVVSFPGTLSYGPATVPFTDEPTITAVVRTTGTSYAFLAGQPIDHAITAPSGGGGYTIGNAPPTVPTGPTGDWQIVTARWGKPGVTQRAVTVGGSTAAGTPAKEPPASMAFRIAGMFSSRYHFTGDIREIRVYDRRLTDEEVYELHIALSTQYGITL